MWRELKSLNRFYAMKNREWTRFYNLSIFVHSQSLGKVVRVYLRIAYGAPVAAVGLSLIQTREPAGPKPRRRVGGDAAGVLFVPEPPEEPGA